MRRHLGIKVEGRWRTEKMENWTRVHLLEQVQFSKSLAWLEQVCAPMWRRYLKNDTGELDSVRSSYGMRNRSPSLKYSLFIKLFTVETINIVV